jgi:DNA modification methylase
MREIKGNYGKCIFTDCLAPEGMPSFKDKQFDLIFSDPPWGYDYDGQTPNGINKKATFHDRINYEDSFDDKFNKKFHNEMLRVSRSIVMIMGRIHLFWWIRNTEPIDLFTLVFRNGQGGTKISKYNGTCHFLCYGDQEYWKDHKFHRNFYETYIHNGFLRLTEYKLIHPSPKDFNTAYDLIKELNPKSVLDPFFGSGCVGEVCEALGVSYVGLEICEDYAGDIEQRIQAGIKRRSYMKLTHKKITEV